MKRIDLLGAPGVGKTTLYNELLKQRKRSTSLLTIEETKLLIAKHYVRNNITSIKEFVRFLLLHSVNNRVFQKKISENIYVSLANKSLRDKLEEWMPFISFCSQALGDSSKPPYYRFLLAKWFLNQLDDVALVESVNLKYNVIFDDSLSQRATGMISWNYSLAEIQCEKYFKLLPLPGAVVHLHTEPHQILERINERQNKKIIAQHKNLSSRDLLERTKIACLITKTGAGILRRRGVPILELDALLPVKNMVDQIKKFIDNNFNMA